MKDSQSQWHRPLRWLYLAAGVGVAIGLAAMIAYLGPLPPRVVVMTTGAPGGAYDEIGQRYRAILARSNVELRLMPSAGAVENLERLNDPRSDVSVGLVQGGLTSQSESPALRSLGTLSYEPLWFFYRGANPGPRLAGLTGRRIAIGPEGSGSRALALRLLALNEIDQSAAQLVPQSGVEAADQIVRGEIDAAIMVAAPESSAVRRLLASPQVNLAGFPRADAYVALYPYLDKVVVPAGIGNMKENRPPANTTLLASKSSLVVREDLHPAIQYLLLDAAVEVHSGPGILHKAGTFPAAERIDLPLTENAQQFYKSGRPLLQRHLPFWLAVLATQLLLLLVPVVGIAYPLLRLAPAAFIWSLRRRVYHLYGQLKLIEVELERSTGNAAELLERLNRLEENVNHLRMPLFFTQYLYTLRQHISLVRLRLQRQLSGEGGRAAA